MHLYNTSPHGETRVAEDASGWEKLIDGVVDVFTKYRLIERLIQRLTNEKAVILLCGSSGVGKSQFVASLQEPTAKPIEREARTRTWRRLKVSHEKKKLEILDTPGQAGDSRLRAQARIEAIKSGRFGIINVVSYGYHEGVDVQDDAVERTKSGYRAKPSFLTRARELEVTALDEWRNELIDAKWLITLVNKADLWWHPDTYEKVLQEYSTTGHYAKRLEHWQGKHIVLPYASTTKPFFGLVPMSGLLGDDRRLVAQANALNELNTLVGRMKS